MDRDKKNLPSSLAAVVKTSPQGSGEIGTNWRMSRMCPTVLPVVACIVVNLHNSKYLSHNFFLS